MKDKHITKLIKKAVIFAFMTSILIIPAYANSFIPNEPVLQSYTTSKCPRADKIETKFRVTSDNVLQYRRWNATKGVWVDSDWINY